MMWRFLTKYHLICLSSGNGWWIAKGIRSGRVGTTANDRKLRTQLQLTRGFELQKVPIFATAFGNVCAFLINFRYQSMENQDFQGSRTRSLTDLERLTQILGAQESPERPQSGVRTPKFRTAPALISPLNTSPDAGPASTFPLNIQLHEKLRTRFDAPSTALNLYRAKCERYALSC